jgi:hypothetical protein
MLRRNWRAWHWRHWHWRLGRAAARCEACDESSCEKAKRLARGTVQMSLAIDKASADSILMLKHEAILAEDCQKLQVHWILM